MNFGAALISPQNVQGPLVVPLNITLQANVRANRSFGQSGLKAEVPPVLHSPIKENVKDPGKGPVKDHCRWLGVSAGRWRGDTAVAESRSVTEIGALSGALYHPGEGIRRCCGYSERDWLCWQSRAIQSRIRDFPENREINREYCRPQITRKRYIFLLQASRFTWFIDLKFGARTASKVPLLSRQSTI